MKKINALFLTLIAGIAISTAQSPVPHTYPALNNADAKVKPGSLTEKVFQTSNKTGYVESLWISYAASMETYQTNQGNTPSFTRAGNYLFPDSLPLAQFGSATSPTFGSPWVNGLTAIFDPKSIVITSSAGDNFVQNTEYTIDSMGMNMIYVRNHADTAIVDTLIINVMSNDKGTTTTSNFPTYGFTGATAANYGVARINFMDVLFDTMSVWNNNSYDGTTPGLIPQALSRQGDMMTIKVPLTAADSSLADPVTGSSFIKTAAWAVNMTVNTGRKGKVVGTFITFKPGYTYQLGDSLSNLNYVRFFSREENDGGYQTYFDKDFNSCGIIPQAVRYGTSPGNWNGLSIPSYAYTAPYAFEYHDILWKVTGLNLAVSKTEDKNGNTLRSAYPNPTNGNASITIPFTLAKASDVAINLMDAQGRLVKSINNAKFNSGDNQIEMSTEGLANGLYYINMNIDGSNLSKSISVIK